MSKPLKKLFEPDLWREHLLDNEVEVLRRIIQDLMFRVKRYEHYGTACPVCHTLLKRLEENQDAAATAALGPPKE